MPVSGGPGDGRGRLAHQRALGLVHRGRRSGGQHGDQPGGDDQHDRPPPTGRCGRVPGRVVGGRRSVPASARRAIARSAASRRSAGSPAPTGSRRASGSGRRPGRRPVRRVLGGTAGWRADHRADTGSVGRRRRPGMADSTEPTPIRPAPTHSHMTSGCSTTPKRPHAAAGGDGVDGQVDVVTPAGVDGRRAHRCGAGAELADGRGEMPPPSTRRTAWRAECDGEVTVRVPTNSMVCPAKVAVWPGPGGPRRGGGTRWPRPARRR